MVELELYFCLTKRKEVICLGFKRTQYFRIESPVSRPSQPGSEREVTWTITQWHFLSSHTRQLQMNFWSLDSLSLISGRSQVQKHLRRSPEQVPEFSQPALDDDVNSQCESPPWGHLHLCCRHNHQLSWSCFRCWGHCFVRSSRSAALSVVLTQVQVHRCWCGCCQADRSHGHKSLSCLSLLFGS